MYEHPYRPDAEFITLLWERLKRDFLQIMQSTSSVDAVSLSSIPSHLYLNALLEVSFWASLQKQEGRSTAFSLAYTPPEQVYDPYIFEKALPFTAESLVKLAPALEPSDTYIGVWPEKDGRLIIWGFTSFSAALLKLHTHEPGQVILSCWNTNALIT